MTPEQVQARLAFDLPPATLVLGPGAGHLVFGACAEYGWSFRFDLNAAAVRQLRDEACLAPLSGLRVIVACLDGASAQLQNMLLKVLEESPDSTRFVLSAEKHLLPTVESRCQVLTLGYEAGEPETASTEDVAAVGSVIRAARARQPSQVAQAVRGWWKNAAPGERPAPARLLTVWASEAASGRWQVFSPDLAPGVSPDRALRLLAELGKRPGSRLSPVVALDLVFRQE